MTRRMTRRLLCASAAVVAAVGPTLVFAQATGTAVRLVVPFAPGGFQDILGRYLATKLSTRLGVPVIVDNKAGAGGIVAAEAVAKAPPDGNTLLLATGGAISIAPHVNAKLPYDPQKDFIPVALLADTPMTLSVRTQSPYKSVDDVLNDARARPDQVSFASSGNASVSHLTGELLAQGAGVQFMHVPYRGGAPATLDLLSGQVSMIVTSTAFITPLVNDGKARILATFTHDRIAGLGDVPTIAEATRISGLEVPVWIGILAPAKTPSAVADRLSAAFEAVCRLGETQERLRLAGGISLCGSGKDLERVVAEDTQRWRKVIRKGNIKE